MAAARVPSAFEGFKRLSSSNYIYDPPTTVSTRSSDDPSVVVFLSWMEALPKHIAKYLNHYKQTYPHARILLITSSSYEFLWRTKAADFAHFGAAATVLESLPADAKVLVHAMSNGGGCAVSALAQEYNKRKNAPLPADAMILDSCPGLPHYWSAWKAMMNGVPKNFIFQLLGGLFFHIYLSCYSTYHNIFFIEDILRAQRRLLNTESLFAKDVPRLYIFGDDDKVVFYPDIQKHAEEAKKLGWPVEEMKFEGAGHVASMMKYETRYWEAVTKLWKGL